MIAKRKAKRVKLRCYRCDRTRCRCRDGITLYHGDCGEVLPRLAAHSVDFVLTDPPYHLTQASRNGRTGLGSASGFMGHTWDGGNIAFQPALWAEVLRVAKPGAGLLAFGGTRTFHRLMCALEDAGWGLRDCLCWLYGTGYPKNHNISKALDKVAGAKRKVVGLRTDADGRCRATEPHAAIRYARDLYGKDNRPATEIKALTAPATAAARKWNGWGTGLKPAWEPITLAMAPMRGTFAANAVTHGVSGLAIGRARIGSKKRTNQAKKPRGRSVAMDWFSGCGARVVSGRWPSNVLLGHHPECGELTCHPDCPVAILDGQSGQSTSPKTTGRGPARTGNAYSIGKAGQGTQRVECYGDAGGASRFFYCPKAGKGERVGRHPTVKPLALIRYLLTLLSSPTGGSVLDPFAGTGTTGVVCQEFGRPAILVELSKRYCNSIAKRLRR